jgi:electron transport complex protein RnfG
MKLKSLTDAWLVIALSTGFGVMLAGVHGKLAPVIQVNRSNDILKQIPALVPGSVRAETAQRNGADVYRATDADGRTIGWVVPGSGQGFADVILTLVGLDESGRKITGLYVAQQSETPGLGDRIRDEEFRNRFQGRSTDKPLVVVKRPPESDEQIEGVTGATVSSLSVVQIVNQATARFHAAAEPSPETKP